MGNFKTIERPSPSSPFKGRFKQEKKPGPIVPTGAFAESSLVINSRKKGLTYRTDRIDKWNEVNALRKEMGLELLPKDWAYGRNRIFNPKYEYEKGLYKNWAINQRARAWKETRKQLRKRNRAFGPASFKSSHTRQNRKSSLFRKRGKTSLIQRALQTGLSSNRNLGVPQ